METLGRGFLYCLVGAGVLLLFALLTQSHINVPCYVALPLAAIAFFVAHVRTKSRRERDAARRDEKLVFQDDATCPECGYMLRGLQTPRCPECGTPFTFVRFNQHLQGDRSALSRDESKLTNRW